MTKQPWYGGGGSGDLLDLVGVNDDLSGLDGQDGSLSDLVGVNKDLTGLDGQNYNRDDENNSDGPDSRPAAISTLTVSDDVSKSKFKKLGDRRVDLDGDLGAVRSIQNEVLSPDLARLSNNGVP